MSVEPFHWFVLSGGLSPYTLQLWEMVTSRSGQSVTLAHVPREDQVDFVHEGDFIHSDVVEIVPIQSIKAVTQLAIRCSKARRAAIVCMGHSPIYNVLISAMAGLASRSKTPILYASDTNGVVLADRASASWAGGLALPAKRAVLGRIFPASLDLGFSNNLAHRLLGIRRSIGVPLLPIEFPASMEPVIPEPLAPQVSALPGPRLLAVARLVRIKNMVGLVEAFTQAIGEGMPGSLTIIGEGPERSRIDPLICKIRERAILAGAVPFSASRRVFGAFDGMVMMSTFEPWGIVIVEGLGWGVPVLSSRECGAGISMALEGGDAVRLCGTSTHEMKTGLVDFVRNLSRHQVAAAAIAPKVRDKFSMTSVADALIAFGRERGA